MEENSLSNENISKSLFTAKNVLRVLSLLCIIFVFCPSFLVSCSGQELDVSVITAIKGVSKYGEKVADAHPIMLTALLIPVAMLVLLFVKKFTDNKTAAIVLCCGTVDMIIWIIFRISVKRAAEESYCTFETTAWYVLNIIALILIILLTLPVVMKKMRMDTDLISIFSGGGILGSLSQMADAVTQIAGNVTSNAVNKPLKENVIGYCSKCGSPIEYGCKFCTSCGTLVPESMLAEAEAAKKAEEKIE